MQAVALSFKADHYYFNNEPDSLKAWIPRVQAFARANDQPTYYFFTWSRLILYYTKHGQYTLAQYELERYMAQAEQDDYKPAIAEAYKQLGHIYRTRGLKETAADYYRKAIGFIEENNLSKFSLPILYSELATVLIDTGRYEEAAEELEKRQGAAHPARIHLAAEAQAGDSLQPDRPERRSPHAVRPDPAGTRRIPYDGQPHRSAACHRSRRT